MLTYAFLNSSDINTVSSGYGSHIETAYYLNTTTAVHFAGEAPSAVETAIQTILETGPSRDLYSDYFSDVANVTFSISTDESPNVDFTVGMMDNTTHDGSNSPHFSGGDVDSPAWTDLGTNTAYGGEAGFGDVWLNAGASQVNNWTTAAPGSFAFQTLLHELGHTMGLVDLSAPGGIDSAENSIMALDQSTWYINNGMTNYTGANLDGVFLSGLQIDDILAIQSIYGAEYTTRSGNTVYGMGHGFGSTPSSEFVYTIWDGGGTNVIDASSYSGPAFINLNQGTFSSIGPADDGFASNNVAIAYGTIIQNAIGTQGHDVFVGNLWNNVLAGTGGDNTFYTDQQLIGLAGTDWSHNDNPGTVGSQWTVPTVQYIALPTLKADVLIGDGSNNVFYVGRANDVIDGGYDLSRIDSAANSIMNGWGTDGSSNFWDSAHQFTADSSGHTNNLGNNGAGQALTNLDPINTSGNTVDYSKLNLEDTLIAPSHAGIDVTMGSGGNGIVEKGALSGGVGVDGTDYLLDVDKITGTAGDDTFTLQLKGGVPIQAIDGGGGTNTLTFQGGTLNENNGVLYDDNGQKLYDPTSAAFHNNFTNLTIGASNYDWIVGNVNQSGPIADTASLGHVYNNSAEAATVTFTQVLDSSSQYFITYGGLGYTFSNDLVTQVQFGNGNEQFYGSGTSSIVNGDDVSNFYGTNGNCNYFVNDVGSAPLAYNPDTVNLITGTGNDVVDIPGTSYRDVNITYTGGNDTYKDLGTATVHLDSQIVTTDVTFFGTTTDPNTGVESVTLVIAGKGTLTLSSGTPGTFSHDVVLDSGGVLHVTNTGFTTDGSFTGTAPINLTWGDDNFSMRNDLGVGGTIYGYGGHDSIGGSVYRDVIFGGSDGNTIAPGGGNDTVTTGSGDDLIQIAQNPGDDVISTGGGSDTVDLRGETDFTGHTTVTGGASFGDSTQVLLPTFGAPQTMHVSGDQVTFEGFTGSVTTAHVQNLVLGNDSYVVQMDSPTDLNVSGGTGDNTYFGSDSNDFINAGSGNDTIYGNGGDDNLSTGAGNNYVDGGSGNDSIFVNGVGNNVIDGGDGSNLLGYLVNGDNTISVSNGIVNSSQTGTDQIQNIETIEGGFGYDTIHGDPNHSYVLDGYFGNDTLYAGNMGDTLLGEQGNDTLIGGIGNDTLDGGTGADILQGGLGDDTYIYKDGPLVDTITDAGGNDTLLFGPGFAIQDLSLTYVGTTLDVEIANHIYVQVNNATSSGQIETIAFNDGSSYDVVNNAYTFVGSEGNDTFTGGTGDDTIFGNGGDDTLIGGFGSDTIYGGAGNDTIIENVVDRASDDYLYGGSGHNVYEFTAPDFQGGFEIFGGGGAGDFDEIRLPTFGPSFGATQSLYIGGDYIYYDAESGFIDYQNVQSIVLGNDPTVVYLDETDQAPLTVISGGTGDNTYFGTSGIDQIQGGSGNDVINGGDGDNTLGGNDGNDTITGGLGNEVISGGAGDDTIYGVGGNDTITGGTGNDVINAGPDDDVFKFSNGDGQDIITDAGGFDSVVFDATVAVASVTYAQSGNDLVIHYGTGTDQITVAGFFDNTSGGQIEQVVFADGTVQDENYILQQINGGGGGGGNTITGTTGDDVLTGTANSDTIYGLAGNDTIDGGAGADTMIGGTGNDTYYVDNAGDVITENPGEGTDLVFSSVSYTLPANVEYLTLTGTANINATGNGLVNILTGNDGNNVLDGKGGADTMIGGLGDDTYVVNNALDVVIENSGQGHDLIQSSVSYTLSSNVEDLLLTGTSNIKGFGNDLDNALTGNSGNNSLDGGLGADTMAGGLGNDTYFVDNAGDVVTENPGEGTDIVLSSITYALPENVENLTLTGTANINATGNELNNTIIGNSGDNIIDGGAGADLMKGGLGNDTYYVDNAGDRIVDSGGNDTVITTVSYTLPNGIENLILAGDGDINGGGNNLSNTITGNDGNNTITGSGGIDVIYGMAGNDVLNGGGGADTLIGGRGDDTYVVDNANDVLTENAGEGVDTVQASVSWTLGDNFENLTLTGTGNIKGTGNALDNIITGNVGNNSLDGGGGNDTLIGGLGDDTYIVNNAGVTIIENAGEGIDTVRASISYTLTDNVDNLVLTGSAAINGTGNALDNVITGNGAINTLSGLDGNDTLNGGGAADVLLGGDGIDILNGNGGNDSLDGGAGADTMAGGTGNDTYFVDNPNDVVIENPGEGNDTVVASVSYTLAPNVEHLILTGTDAIDGTGNDGGVTMTGNSAVNHLIGGAGNDTFDGGGGADTLIGGLGDDTYIVNNTGVTIIENLGEGNDTVQSSISYTLPDNVENLILTGTAAIDGTGNALDNVLTGNSAVNNLSGLDGNDTIFGGGGKDILNGGNGDDVLYGQGGADTLTGGLGADTFVFQATTAYGAVDTVTDFHTSEGDKIDISNLLTAYDPLTMHLSDFVHLTVSGGNTIISVDRDGTGTAYGFNNIATLTGVTTLPDVDTMVANGNLVA